MQLNTFKYRYLTLKIVFNTIYSFVRKRIHVALYNTNNSIFVDR